MSGIAIWYVMLVIVFVVSLFGKGCGQGIGCKQDPRVESTWNYVEIIAIILFVFTLLIQTGILFELGNIFYNLIAVFGA